MFFISLCMKSENATNDDNIIVDRLYEDDYSYFYHLKSVFDNADNIKLVESTEYGGGGGLEGMGGSDLVYETESGIRIYLGIDGGFPVPELSYMYFRCSKYTDTLAKELCVAFSKYFQKNFEHYELIAEGDSPSLCLYENESE